MVKFPSFTKKNVNKVKRDFEKINGNKVENFSIKEIVMMLNNDLLYRCEKIEEALVKHLEWSEKNLEKGNKFMRDHDKYIARIAEQLKEIARELPEKGFCEKVENALALNKKTTLSDKVELLWHDRRWIKAILIFLIALTSGTFINIFIQVF